MLIENDGTIVISGIYTQNGQTDINRVPLPGDISVLGNLFENTNKINSRTELLAFLAPRVLSDQLPLK